MPFGFFPMVGPAELVILMFTAIFVVWPAWRICAKAGFPGSLGLLAALPLLNVFLLFYLAFAEWPAHRRRKPDSFRDF